MTRSPTPLEVLGGFHEAGVQLEPVPGSDAEVDWVADRDPTQAELAIVQANAPQLAEALRRVYLDFETTSAVDLKAGTAAYARHASTRVLMLCWAVGLGPVQIWKPGSPCPDELRQAIEAGYVAVAHNHHFEAAIWQAQMVPLGWPPIADDQWSCTMARARAARYPASLKHLGRRLGLRHRKDPRGVLLIGKLKAGLTLTPEEHRDLDAYCRQDVEALRESDYRLPELSDKERATWLLDARMNARGLPVDVESAWRLDVILQAENVRLEAQMYTLAGLTPSQLPKLLTQLQANGASLPNMQGGTLEAWLALHGTPAGQVDDETLPVAERIIRCRTEYASSAGTKLQQIATSVEADHRIRGCFQWHGAHTGRWAGRGVQPQNFPRVPKGFDSVAELAALLESREGVSAGASMSIKARIAACLRALIQAPDGYVLVVVDLAQIENRVLCWLAGQENMLAGYHRPGWDPYIATARTLGSDNRQLGKLVVLSAGFGSGGEKLRRTAPDHGVALTLAEADLTIARWRQANPRIIQCWRDLQDTMVAAVEAPPDRIWRCPHGSPCATTVTAFKRSGEDTLRVELPSGRQLIYHQPRMVESEDYPGRFELTYQQVKGDDWQEEHSYGGRSVENVVQAVAYDLIADAMLRMEQGGIEILGTVHDEVIALAKRENASATLHEMISIMSTPPDWAKGLPLAAKGYHNERYVKPSGQA